MASRSGVDLPFEDGRQLPAEVHRVLQTQVQPGSPHRGMHMRGVADQDHPAQLIPRRDARVDAEEPAQIQWHVGRCRPQRHLRAEDPLQAGLQFGQAHGRFVTVSWAPPGCSRAVLSNSKTITTARPPSAPARENSPLDAMEPQGRDATKPGHVQRAADRIDPFGRRQHVESHPCHHVVRRHPGEIDTGQLAGHAGAAVGADRGTWPSARRHHPARDVHRDAVVVLVETGQR